MYTLNASLYSNTFVEFHDSSYCSILCIITTANYNFTNDFTSVQRTVKITNARYTYNMKSVKHNGERSIHVFVRITSTFVEARDNTVLVLTRDGFSQPNVFTVNTQVFSMSPSVPVYQL